MLTKFAICSLIACWLGGGDARHATAGKPMPKDGTVSGQKSTFILPVRLPERKPPARDFSVKHTLSVAHFGATPDDGKDDLASIRIAMNKAAALKEPTRLLFPKGTYDLFLPEDPDQDLIYQASRDCLAFFRASNIIFDGQGSTIMIHEPTLGFLSLLSCDDVIVRNFIVEWKTPPFAQGWIRKIDLQAGCFEFEETPGFLSLDSPIWQAKNRKHYATIRWGMLKDRTSPGRMKAGVGNFFEISHWEKLGPYRFRLYPKSKPQLKDFEVGDPYVHVDRNGGGLCRFTHCNRIVFENITNHTSPGLNYGGAHSTEIALFNCKVLIKPGYWHTSNADGMHFSQHRIGPWVEGCTFEGMSDDGANLYAHPTHVSRVVSDQEFELGPTVDWRPSDLVLGFEPNRGKVLGKARVISASFNGETLSTHLTLDQPIPGMKSGTSEDRKKTTYLLNLNLSSSNFVFRNNRFRNVRRFGILLQTHDGLIEGNTFDGVSSSAIIVRNSAGWPEGFATGNITIRGNTIRDCNFDWGLGGFNAGDITVHVLRNDGRNGLSRAISRVEILSNTVINTRRRAINIASTTNVKIADNVIRCDDPTTPAFLGKKVTPIHLFDVDRITVHDNTILEPRNMVPGGVAMKGECSAVDVRNNRLVEN